MKPLPPFHGDEFKSGVPADSLFHVIPVPWEDTVSYGGGTGEGPAAILEASAQLESNLGRFVPGSHGIHTMQAVDCEDGAEEVLARIEAATARVLRGGKLPVLLGGEHTVTLGALRAFAARGKTVGVVQFDAHADLRDSYEGSKYSHACVMRRAHELGFPLFQIGVRAPCIEELDYRQAHAVPHLDARTIWELGIPERPLPPDFPEEIYLTFDVDGLDPSIMPATGTPVPGGLSWREAVVALERVCQGRRVVGMDVVELAPRPHDHASNFAAALLCYTMMDLAARSRA